jgi:site-specific recombinase XerD
MPWAVEAVEDYMVNTRPRYGFPDRPALWLTERGGGLRPRQIDGRFAAYHQALKLPSELVPQCLRHCHKTLMAEDGTPEILAEQRPGHQVPGMRGLYAHASQRMRDELAAALQHRWEQSLRERAGPDPLSPVPLLDNLLAPFRAPRLPKIGRTRQPDAL